MIVWVFYVKEIERFERDNRVKIYCEDSEFYLESIDGERDLNAVKE
jgi:hypothetical protein